ncbi:MAG: hypothetical protein DRN18_00085 [Thermoplasmata archaeon]|nr:MAG: hypothetical protein DRN18_00085 [Thermoplasmata archaeon]
MRVKHSSDIEIEGDESRLPSSPAEFKHRLIMKELAKCIEHLAKSYNDDREKYAFIMRVKTLHHLLLPYTPTSVKRKTKKLAKEYEKKIKEEVSKIASEEGKKKKELEIAMEFAEKLHYQNIQIIDNSKMMEEEVEGVIDLEDASLIEAVRHGGKDVDAKPVSLVP